MSTILKCVNVRKKYMTTVAVRDVNLELEKGKIYAVLGPNGSGKSTLMKMMVGLIHPTSGTIYYDGKELKADARKDIAYMPTENYFYSYMKVKDIAAYYSDFFPDFDQKKFYDQLKEMKLPENIKLKNMSTGMLAKVKLAAALSRNTKLLLLDEPLNGIDLIARENIIRTIIENASPDRTILISSHIVNEMESIVDGAIFIKDGENVMVGDAEELREKQGCSLVDIYKQIYA